LNKEIGRKTVEKIVYFDSVLPHLNPYSKRVEMKKLEMMKISIISRYHNHPEMKSINLSNFYSAVRVGVNVRVGGHPIIP
jgi:hypothetical protein